MISLANDSSNTNAEIENANTKVINSTDEQKKLNLKKIKYKIKNVSYQEYIKNFTSGCHKAIINCSYDFLVSQYGRPQIISNNKYVKASWYLKIITSNNQEYYFDIYDWEEYNTELKDITTWHVGGKVEDCEYLDYDKLTKLINYQISNFSKKQEKIYEKKQIKTAQTTQTIQYEKTKYIDLNKYKQIDNDKLKEFTDDDLACVLFTRFKESGNFLLKEALIIHKTLEEPSNYNRHIETKTTATAKTNYNKKDDKKEYKNKFKTYSLKNISITNNKKDKSKYNNKRDKIKKPISANNP